MNVLKPGLIFVILMLLLLLLSHAQLIATPWIAACQAPLSSSISQFYKAYDTVQEDRNL